MMQRKIQLLVKILYGSPCISYNEPDNTDSHFEACKLYMYLSYVFNNRGQRTTKYFVHEECPLFLDDTLFFKFSTIQPHFNKSIFTNPIIQ